MTLLLLLVSQALTAAALVFLILTIVALQRQIAAGPPPFQVDLHVLPGTPLGAGTEDEDDADKPTVN
jgi:hypothetical protein